MWVLKNSASPLGDWHFFFRVLLSLKGMDRKEALMIIATMLPKAYLLSQ